MRTRSKRWSKRGRKSCWHSEDDMYCIQIDLRTACFLQLNFAVAPFSRRSNRPSISMACPWITTISWMHSYVLRDLLAMCKWWLCFVDTDTIGVASNSVPAKISFIYSYLKNWWYPLALLKAQRSLWLPIGSAFVYRGEVESQTPRALFYLSSNIPSNPPVRPSTRLCPLYFQPWGQAWGLA